MKIKTVISVSSVSLLFVTWGAAGDAAAREMQSIQPDVRTETRVAIDPQAFVKESLGSSVAADIYRVSCIAECIQADVNDAGPYDDTRFKVEINGSSPAFVGNASAFNPTGGLSQVAEVCSGQNINRQRMAYITYTEVNSSGPENYDTVITCRTAGGAIINPSVIKILDQ
ncbi:MAG: hypothetical protein ACU837_05075 [Gammaproteobacteria bacterium]